MPSPSRQILLLDGGSTFIRDCKDALSAPSPIPIPPELSCLWTSSYTVTRPDLVLQYHELFLRAGSDIVTTNTYQFPRQSDLGGADIDLSGAIATAVEMALEAVRKVGREEIALSLGTRNAVNGVSGGEYADYPAYSIDEYAAYQRGKLQEFHKATGGNWDKIGYLAFETLSSFEEAKAVLDALAVDEFSPWLENKKVWISFSCGDGSVPRMEDILTRVLSLPTSEVLWGIGFNCMSASIAVQLARMLADHLRGRRLALVLYPDGSKSRAPHDYTDEDVLKWGQSLMEVQTLTEGDLLLGGCCHTDPRFITALSNFRH